MYEKILESKFKEDRISCFREILKRKFGETLKKTLFQACYTYPEAQIKNLKNGNCRERSKVQLGECC